MTPFLLAVALAVSPAAPQPDFNLQPGLHPNLQPGLHTLQPPTRSFDPAVAACGRLNTQTVAPDGVKIFKKLNELPWGQMEHAVWRRVEGCPVREIVFGGETYYVVSGNPRVERLAPDAYPLGQR
jgi:hypothetical protein